jgi:hypothetical protein
MPETTVATKTCLVDPYPTADGRPFRHIRVLDLDCIRQRAEPLVNSRLKRLDLRTPDGGKNLHLHSRNLHIASVRGEGTGRGFAATRIAEAIALQQFTRTAFKRGRRSGASPSHSGHTSGLRITGIRLWSSAHNSFGVVVMIAEQPRTLSPAGTLCQCKYRYRNSGTLL